MKLKKTVSTLLACLMTTSIACTVFTGCDETETPETPAAETTPVYTISFDSTGGSDIPTQNVERGDAAIRPEDPEREGYTFAGWYYGNNEYDFSGEVTRDKKLVAKWTKNAPDTYSVTFETGDGSAVRTKYVRSGGTVYKPQSMQQGKYVDYWTADGETEYDFSAPITEDKMLTAVWANGTLSYKLATGKTVMRAGDTASVAASTDVADGVISYESSNPDAIAVDENGVLDMKKAGLAEITAAVTKNGDVKLEESITVCVIDDTPFDTDKWKMFDWGYTSSGATYENADGAATYSTKGQFNVLTIEPTYTKEQFAFLHGEGYTLSFDITVEIEKDGVAQEGEYKFHKLGARNKWVDYTMLTTGEKIRVTLSLSDISDYYGELTAGTGSANNVLDYGLFLIYNPMYDTQHIWTSKAKVENIQLNSEPYYGDTVLSNMKVTSMYTEGFWGTDATIKTSADSVTITTSAENRAAVDIKPAFEKAMYERWAEEGYALTFDLTATTTSGGNAYLYKLGSSNIWGDGANQRTTFELGTKISVTVPLNDIVAYYDTLKSGNHTANTNVLDAALFGITGYKGEITVKIENFGLEYKPEYGELSAANGKVTSMYTEGFWGYSDVTWQKGTDGSATITVPNTDGRVGVNVKPAHTKANYERWAKTKITIPLADIVTYYDALKSGSHTNGNQVDCLLFGVEAGYNKKCTLKIENFGLTKVS